MVVCNSTLSATHWDVDPVVGKLSLHTLGWIICTACTNIACVISAFLIYKHATNYTNKNEQRQIIRILLMVPIYSITTTFSYIWYWHAVYWEFARDCYEAFAISAFFTLMCSYVAPELRDQKEYFAAMTVDPWPWPITWLNKCTKGKFRQPRSGLTWFNLIYICVFQYCFVRVATTVIATVTQATGHYCEDSFNPAFAHFWMQFFNVLAVSVAMYMLIAFYLQLRSVLAPKEPLLKLLCIKLVIFFSFWQMIILDFLTSTKIIKPTKTMSPGDISIGINALLICTEMILFSIMHLYAFPWRLYQTSDLGPAVYKQPPRSRAFAALMDVFNPLDTLKALGRGVKWSLVGRKRRHAEAEKIAARRAAKTSHGEEGQGLVNNAGELANHETGRWSGEPGAYGEDDGLYVQHPSPNDQENIMPSHRYVSTEYRPPAVEMTATTRPVEPSSALPPDPVGSLPPAFARMNEIDLPDRRTAGAASNPLPYPAISTMPSMRRSSSHYTTASPSSHHSSPLDEPTSSYAERSTTPNENYELLEQHADPRPPAADTGVATFTYSESIVDSEGVYRGPNPRRKQDADDVEDGRPSRKV